ncbi:hypothetical protein P9869_43070 [Streptomyces ossamyceticus]|nr:hypothetical protein [Streptomyces ossamyceticus]
MPRIHLTGGIPMASVQVVSLWTPSNARPRLWTRVPRHTDDQEWLTVRSSKG